MKQKIVILLIAEKSLLFVGGANNVKKLLKALICYQIDVFPTKCEMY